MTLDQLRAFCTAAEKGSFRTAAETLFRSQSAISIAIRNLETELGVTLFSRDGYRPELTTEGKALLDRARHLVNQASEMQAVAGHLSSGKEAELRLAISGIVPIEPVIDILNKLSEEAPATKITLQIENLKGAMERLTDDDADIAITDVFEPDSGIDFVLLTQVEFVSVVPPTSPLAQMADSLRESDVYGTTVIVVRDTSIHSERVSKGIINGTHQWVVNDFMMKRRIIKSGTGWGRMPRHLVEGDIESGELVMLTSESFKPIYAPVYMVRKRGRTIGPVENSLWNQLAANEWHNDQPHDST